MLQVTRPITRVRPAGVLDDDVMGDQPQGAAVHIRRVAHDRSGVTQWDAQRELPAARGSMRRDHHRVERSEMREMSRWVGQHFPPKMVPTLLLENFTVTPKKGVLERGFGGLGS